MRDGTPITSVNIVVGPKSQKRPLFYNKKANRIYISWGFEDQIRGLIKRGDNEKILELLRSNIKTSDGGLDLNGTMAAAKLNETNL